MVINTKEIVLASEKLINKEHNIWIMLITEIEHKNWNIVIINIHGLAYPWTKLDSDLRIIQYDNFIAEIQHIDTSKKIIIMGDFNLHPETNLIKKLSQDFINLNIKFNIQDTRWPWNITYYGTKEYQPYADYGFSSLSLHIQSLETSLHENIISDHKALLLTLCV